MKTSHDRLMELGILLLGALALFAFWAPFLYLGVRLYGGTVDPTLQPTP